MAVVVFGLKIWRHYPNGVRCEIFADHKSLNYIFTQIDLNMRHRRCLELVKHYACEIHYHQEKGNSIADALSRKEEAKLMSIQTLHL